MHTDEMYNRTMGYHYDPERLHTQLGGGTAGQDGKFDRENGFTLTGSDLYIETSTDQSTYRLQEIEFEVASIFESREISHEMAQELVLLETEKIIRLGTKTQELMARDPESMTVLRDLFTTHLMDRAEAGAPVDAEMFIELDKLACEIARQNDHLDTAGFIELYENMEALIRAQLVIDSVDTTPKDDTLVLIPAR